MNQIEFKKIIDTFPDETHEYLMSIPKNRGVLSGADTQSLIKLMETDVETLMIRLLPLAGLWAKVPISDFQVGAIILGDESELYFGANYEFENLALSQTIHAEQSAAMNAWHQKATGFHTLAVSSAPCGLCRQFLYEFDTGRSLRIVTPTVENQGHEVCALPDLLPKAFGPMDLYLDKQSRLMASKALPISLELHSAGTDPLIASAWKAAQYSYAPYTKNHAGCAIQSIDDRIWTGRYAENAAFNPGVSPLQSAVACMNMDTLFDEIKIARAVLFERPTRCTQKETTEIVLAAIAPDVKLEYYPAEVDA